MNIMGYAKHCVPYTYSSFFWSYPKESISLQFFKNQWPLPVCNDNARTGKCVAPNSFLENPEFPNDKKKSTYICIV